MRKPSQRKTIVFFFSTKQQWAYKGIIEQWGRAYIVTLGKGSITHYVVSDIIV